MYGRAASSISKASWPALVLQLSAFWLAGWQGEPASGQRVGGASPSSGPPERPREKPASSKPTGFSSLFNTYLRQPTH